MLNREKIISTGVMIIGILIIMYLLIKLNRFVFKKLKKKKAGLHMFFLERINYVVIVTGAIIAVFTVIGSIKYVWRTMLGGTAIISAVVAFAAQDVIKDVLAGLMIIINKPFEIGNRIELENGIAGNVMDITMRHVVINTIDNEMLVIPNSKLNTMTIKNYSYHSSYRSHLFRFAIAYHSDARKAMQLIKQAVVDSDYTVPGKKTRKGMEYAPVYFTNFDDSSLRLITTVYFEPSTASQTVMTDINLRVKYAFEINNIEIPYPFVNIVDRDPDSMKNTEEIKEVRKIKGKTDEMVITSKGVGMDIALNNTEKFGMESLLSRKENLQLRLLAEELFGMIRTILGEVDAVYWIERENKDFKMHLNAEIIMTREIRNQLLNVSSTGKNDAVNGFMGQIKDMISVMLLPIDENEQKYQVGLIRMGMYDDIGSGGRSYEWSMQKYMSEIETKKDKNADASEAWDELEKSIVASIADDIKIGIKGNTIEMCIYKDFGERNVFE